jgi:hypothetical protein
MTAIQTLGRCRPECQRHEPLRVWLSRYSSRNAFPHGEFTHIRICAPPTALSKKHVGAERSRLS